MSVHAVLIAPSWPPESIQNGVSTYLERLVPELPAAGIDARLLPMFVPAEYEERARSAGVIAAGGEPNTPLHYVANRVARLLDPGRADADHAAWKLRRALHRIGRERRVDVHELEEAYGNGRHLAGRAGLGKQVVRLHGPWFLVAPALGLDLEERDERARVRWEGDSIARADAISSPSRHALEEVRRHYGLALPDAVVIPNATPLVHGAHRWSAERAEPRSILFVGRFDRLKGADLVLDALARLHARDARTTLTFVGPDRGMPDGAGGTLTFEQYVEKHVPVGARGALRYLGPRTQAEIAPLRARHAVTVVASRFETFGMTVIEAMAAGAPVVGARAGAIPEILGFAGDELLFRSGDADELAARLEHLFEHPERSAELGALCRRECEQRYAPSSVAGATAELYRRVARR